MDFKLTACFRRIGHMWIGYGFRADCFAAVQSRNRFWTEGGKFATIDAIATKLASPREEEEGSKYFVKKPHRLYIP